MSPMHRRCCTLLFAVLLIVATEPARAGQIFNVSLDTSNLASRLHRPVRARFRADRHLRKHDHCLQLCLR